MPGARHATSEHSSSQQGVDSLGEYFVDYLSTSRAGVESRPRRLSQMDKTLSQSAKRLHRRSHRVVEARTIDPSRERHCWATGHHLDSKMGTQPRISTRYAGMLVVSPSESLCPRGSHRSTTPRIPDQALATPGMYCSTLLKARQDPPCGLTRLRGLCRPLCCLRPTLARSSGPSPPLGPKCCSR